jgi:pimeloyl-ACP methyl ester carboxylesterase
MRRARPLIAALAACTLAGCYFTRSPTRPIPSLAFRREAGARQSCLVIFLPGLMDGPDTIREQGLVRELVRSGAPCDAVAVDLTYRYYFDAAAARVLHDDVLAPAVARGYEEIWIAAISLGGLGAVLLAREHPELIDGIVFLSPYLGLEDVVATIERDGGLERWQPPDPMPTIADSNFTVYVWAWLRGLVTDPDAMPEIWIGWANGERLEPTSRLLARVLPEGRSASLDGRHDWAAWRELFRRFVEAARLGR